MKLEDIVTNHKPCIMDVKLGRRVWDHYADSNKIEKKKIEYPFQETFGVSVIGMQARKSISIM